jgi:hypothetical protein
MRAIALAKYAASARNLVGMLRYLKGGHIIQSDTHSAYLLQEKLARAGGAFIACLDTLNLALLIQMIDQERFATRANYDPVLRFIRQYAPYCHLDSLRLRYCSQIDIIDKFSPRNRQRYFADIWYALQSTKQGLSGITFVGDYIYGHDFYFSPIPMKTNQT